MIYGDDDDGDFCTASQSGIRIVDIPLFQSWCFEYIGSRVQWGFRLNTLCVIVKERPDDNQESNILGR